MNKNYKIQYFYDMLKSRKYFYVSYLQTTHEQQKFKRILLNELFIHKMNIVSDKNDSNLCIHKDIFFSPIEIASVLFFIGKESC